MNPLLDANLVRFAELVARFMESWDFMEGNGQCDARGGMEFQRVFTDWILAGCPKKTREFIRHHANQPARD